MPATLLAKSSGGEPYEVKLHLDQENVFVKCSCRAGIFGKICKHKTAILSGDESILFDPSQSDDLAQIQERIKDTELPALSAKLEAARADVEKAKRRAVRARTQLEKAMRGQN